MGLLDNTRFFEPFPFAIVIVIAYLFIYLFVFPPPSPVKSIAAGSCLQTRYGSSANSLFPSESADLGCACVCLCSGIRVFNSPATTTAPFAFGPTPRPVELLSTPRVRAIVLLIAPHGNAIVHRDVVFLMFFAELLCPSCTVPYCRPRTRRANFIYTTLEMCGQ